MNAYLAEPRNEEEFDMLYNFARKSGWYTFWLGATYSAYEGTWVWQSDGQVLSYDKWHPGANQGVGDCAYMYTRDGLWRNFDCDGWAYIICQKKIEGNIHGSVFADRLKSTFTHIKHIYFNSS